MYIIFYLQKNTKNLSIFANDSYYKGNVDILINATNNMHNPLYILGIALKLCSMNLKTRDGSVWVKRNDSSIPFILQNFICSFYGCCLHLQSISLSVPQLRFLLCILSHLCQFDQPGSHISFLYQPHS